MTVIVRSRSTVGPLASTDIVVHEKGSTFRVDDGHLRVLDEQHRSVAVYADGQWASAVIEDAD